MKEPAWVNREECLAIHEMMLAQHGGLAGVRNEGLLESALSKPQNLFTYASSTHIEMAASYAAGMTSNGFTLADPKDRGMLDVVGFDTTVPAVIADFVRN
jgi:death on curing protein